MSKTIEEAVHEAIMPLLEQNEFVADKNNPHFLDRWWEQYHAAKWCANFALSHQWRSVEDDLPEDGQTVLCTRDDFELLKGHVVLCTYVAEVFCEGDHIVSPTHWMPIPNIPSLNPEQR